jgi:PAS domain-containing protein
MLSGPKHRFTFINQPYVDLIGRSSQPDILMRTVCEVLPELEGQPFIQWLDEVYEKGVQRTGRAQVAHIRPQQSPDVEERYFDFIYYPVRNNKGIVYGVMVQAADVTERVRSEAVSEHREETLFRQWSELDSIYRMAPVGMALLDAKSLRLLRINSKQAEMMGAPVAELLGKRALDLAFIPPALAMLFKRVEAGEAVRNAIVEKEVIAGDTGHRTWLVNISPFLGATGETVAFTSISLEVPDEP